MRNPPAESGVHQHPLAGGRQDRAHPGAARQHGFGHRHDPLVTIDQIHPVKVSFALPQNDLPRIQARQRGKGLTAAVNLQDLGGTALTAPVDFIGNAVNKVSGTIEMRSTFANQDESLGPINWSMSWFSSMTFRCPGGAARSGEYRARRPICLCGQRQEGGGEAGQGPVRQ